MRPFVLPGRAFRPVTLLSGRHTTSGLQSRGAYPGTRDLSYEVRWRPSRRGAPSRSPGSVVIISQGRSVRVCVSGGDTKSRHAFPVVEPVSPYVTAVLGFLRQKRRQDTADDTGRSDEGSNPTGRTRICLAGQGNGPKADGRGSPDDEAACSGADAHNGGPSGSEADAPNARAGRSVQQSQPMRRGQRI